MDILSGEIRSFFHMIFFCPTILSVNVFISSDIIVFTSDMSKVIALYQSERLVDSIIC